jgi:hypothetical protein
MSRCPAVPSTSGTIILNDSGRVKAPLEFQTGLIGSGLILAESNRLVKKKFHESF